MSIGTQPYSKPPVTEAVVEFRHSKKIDQADLAKANKRFSRLYPDGSETNQLHVEISANASGKATSSLSPTGKVYRRASDNEHNVLLLTPHSLAVAQTPPYPGWDVFFERVQRDWAIWRKAIGQRDLSRLGVRYINRIDIPSTGPTLRPNEYLAVFIDSPEELGPTVTYALTCSFLLPKINANLTINSGIVNPPPVPGHVSILLDLDIGREVELPNTEEDMVTLLQGIRDEKNRVFELLVTNQLRGLIR